MSVASIDGREWAKMSDLKVGSVLEFDGDLDCGIAGKVLGVEISDAGEPYVPCYCGRHYLDGQLSDDGDYLVGVWPKD